MTGDKELQLIQYHIVLKEMVRLNEEEIVRIRGSRMPLRGVAERHAMTVLACMTIELRSSREQLRAHRIWVAERSVSQGEDVLVYRYAIQGKPNVFPITRRGLREEVERQGELLADKWERIFEETARK